MLIQKAKPQNLKEKKSQYHGHTTIELKSVRTGRRERIESDNTFTLGIENYIQSGGGLNQSALLNTSPIYQRLLGGIFLFDKEIEAVNGVYPTIMPGGTKMVANGYYGASNNSEVTELGTFNSNESSFNRNGLTFVYDWQTDQGNGDIKCVSLTSNIGGQIGYGNSKSLKRLDDVRSFSNGEVVSILMSGATYNHTMSRRYIYYGASIDESDWTFSFSKKSNAVYTFNILSWDFSETITKNIPSVLQQTGRAMWGATNGRFICLPVNLVQNTTYKLGIYDIESDLWEYIDFTAPVSMTIATSEINAGTSYGFDGFCLLHSASNADANIILIDYATGETDVLISNPWAITRVPMALSDDLVMLTKGSYPNDKNLVLYDRTTKDEYPINATLDAPDHAIAYPWLGDRLIWTYSNENFNIQPKHNPLYLATINNLDNAVVKTTSDTMKVIYTVTPV